MERVYLGLGGNSGDSPDTIRKAFAELSAFLLKPRMSSLYRSAARYYEDQPDFINAVASGLTGMEPLALLAAVNAIETRFGRKREVEIPKGPRTLDIDILLFGPRLVVEPGLVVPHAAMRERKFVLLPMLELDADLTDPASGERIASILASLPPQGIYLLPASDYDRLYL